MHSQEPTRRTPFAWSAVVLWPVVLSGFLLIGADLMWVVSFGDAIRQSGRVPAQVPNLVATQAGWHNPVVLAELLLSWVNSMGWAALPALGVLLMALTLGVIVVDGRRAGGTDVRLAVATSMVAIGAAPAFVIVRFPMLSLLPFVVLVALLRTYDRGNRRAIWWVPALMVLWGNLHGAVLIGLAVLGVFVVAAGRDGARARLVAGALSLLCLVVTSAGIRTPEYYLTALGNEAAARGTDLWARPSLASPLDLAMIITALLLVAMAARSLRLWEWLVVGVLVMGTVSAARHGVWLLLFLAPVAGVPSGKRKRVPTPGAPITRRSLTAVGVVAIALSLGVGGQLARRSEEVRPPGGHLVALVAQVAGTGTVLAMEPEAETFAQQGIRVWAANPIDAFDRRTQSDLLDFLHHCEVPPAAIDVVVTDDRCVNRVVEQGWRPAHRESGRTVLTKEQ